jgi:hypothetical protein
MDLIMFENGIIDIMESWKGFPPKMQYALFKIHYHSLEGSDYTHGSD